MVLLNYTNHSPSPRPGRYRHHDTRGHYQRRISCIACFVPFLLLQNLFFWFSLNLATRPELRSGGDVSFPLSTALSPLNNTVAITTIASNTTASSVTTTNESATSTIDRILDLDNDGTFNGVPLKLHRQGEPHEMYSTVHCAGDNYIRNETHDETWKHRSCEYQFLCFDTETKEFQIFPSERQQQMQEKLRQNRYLRNANDYFHASVSIGAINLAWKEQVSRMEWRPEVVEENTLDSFYMLPEDVVLVPFHSLNAANPGHLIWDDQLPIYTLLHMFQALPEQQTTTTTTTLLPIRYVLHDGVDHRQYGLWASCDYNHNKTVACQHLMKKFWPLMLGSDFPYKLTSTRTFEFEPKATSTGTNTTLVCAKRGMAGIGSLSDHGTAKKHGWEPEDYEMTHNHGRGGLLNDFRNFAVSNLGISVHVPIKPKIIVSQLSTKRSLTKTRDLVPQLTAIQKRFPNAQVEGVILESLSLEEQIRLVSDAAVYITHCGGGAVTGMFLPKGASAILYYPEKGGWKHNQYTGEPAMLDWDLWSALSYLHVHWMPRSTMGTPADLEHLLLLIEQQLSLVEESYATA